MVLCGAGSASAEKKRVGIPSFAGPQEALIRKAVMQAVKAHGYDMVKSRQIDSTASSIGASLDADDGFKALARELALSAFVTGEVGKKKAKLTVRNGADGAINAEESWTAPNPRKLAAEIGKTFWRRLGSAIERGKPPSGAKKASKVAVAAEAPEDNEDAPEAAAGGAGDEEPAAAPAASDSGSSKSNRAAKADQDDSGAGAKPKREAATPEAAEKHDEAAPEAASGGEQAPRALDAWVGPRGFFRTLAFHQRGAGATVSDYLPRLLGDAAVLLDWYPGAHSGSGFIANIGLQLNLEQSFGISSSTATGASYPTNIHDYYGGLRLRIPLGGIEGGLMVGYGQNAFVLNGNDLNVTHVPNTTYNYARAGVGLRVAIGSLSVALGGAWRQVLSVGQIKDLYPHLTVGAVDANLTVGLRVTPLIEARVGGDLRRYFYDMHSKSGDAYTAGGAVDQTIGFMAGVAFIIDGVPRPAASASDEAAPASDEGEVKVKKPKKKKKKLREESEDSSEE